MQPELEISRAITETEKDIQPNREGLLGAVKCSKKNVLNNSTTIRIHQISQTFDPVVQLGKMGISS